ncbi:MAG: toprim domain-containing protein [Methylotenera sp.]|nr:toprim domain-containing protein [Methylotenera sp.]
MIQTLNATNYNTNNQIPHDSYSLIDEFRQAMQAAGIKYCGDIIADGRLHRFRIAGHKQNSLNGAYTLHLDGCPAGFFQDFKSGLSRTWKKSGGSRVSYALLQQMKETKLKHESEIRQKHTAAADKAVFIWSRSKPIAKQSDHAYLVKKRIEPHGARLYRESLVIPIHNEADQLVNLQFINPEGVKRYLSGGRKRGCFHVMGDLSEKILICEGFATGASLHEDNGQRVVIAFDAGNLLPSAKNIRELAPVSELIVCGDNDISGIGQAKAREAALSISGKVLIPPVPGMDWNDYLTGGRHA